MSVNQTRQAVCGFSLWLSPPPPPTLERQCIFVCTVNIYSHELRWQRHPISRLFCLYKCHRFRHLPWERHCLHFSECDVFFIDIADNIFRPKWTQCFLKWFLYIPIHSHRPRIVLITWNRDHSPDYAYVIILIMYREIHFFNIGILVFTTGIILLSNNDCFEF